MRFSRFALLVALLSASLASCAPGVAWCGSYRTAGFVDSHRCVGRL